MSYEEIPDVRINPHYAAQTVMQPDHPMLQRLAPCKAVPGYTSMSTLTQLYESARTAEPDGLNVEIGCLFGKSTAAIAFGVQDSGTKPQTVHVIDPFRSWPGEDALSIFQSQFGSTPEELSSVFRGHMDDVGVRAMIRLTIGTAKDVKLPKGKKVRFAFIDGDHRPEAVRQDVELLLPLMAPGSIMAFDDYGNNRDKWGVQEVVDELVRPAARQQLFKDNRAQCCVFFEMRGGK